MSTVSATIIDKMQTKLAQTADSIQEKKHEIQLYQVEKLLTFLTSRGFSPTPLAVSNVINYFIGKIIAPIADKRMSDEEANVLIKRLNGDESIDDVLTEYFTTAWVEKTHVEGKGYDKTWNSPAWNSQTWKQSSWYPKQYQGKSHGKSHGKGIPQGKANDQNQEQASSSRDWPSLGKAKTDSQNQSQV